DTAASMPPRRSTAGWVAARRRADRPVRVIYRLGLPASLILFASWLSLVLRSSALPSRRSLSLPVALPAVCFALPLISWALYLAARATFLILAFIVIAYGLLSVGIAWATAARSGVGSAASMCGPRIAFQLMAAHPTSIC